MATATAPVTTRPATVPLLRILPGFARDPLSALVKVNATAQGELVQLNLGLARPYLVTHPDHLQHVMRANNANYVREGMFWDPVRRLIGRGILTSGKTWERSRRRLQPSFSARHLTALTGLMAETVNAVVGTLDEPARTGRPVDALESMAVIINQTVVRLFFGDKISDRALDTIIPAFDTAATSIGARLALPWMSYKVPMPGDRAFMRAVRDVDDIVYPLIREQRGQTEGTDVIAILNRAEREDGGALTDVELRDDLVSMFAAATETSAMVLTWLWPALHQNPEVAARLTEEIDRVVGRGNPVTPEHLPGLEYLRMVVQELVRLYPAGWMFTRMAVEDDVVGGHRIKAGSNVMISPFLTHRLTEFWDRPTEFDPERFAPDGPRPAHRYAYLPFGAGPHQCIGMHAFNLEAQLIVAAILARFEPTLVTGELVTPLGSATLRPKQQIQLTLRAR